MRSVRNHSVSSIVTLPFGLEAYEYSYDATAAGRLNGCQIHVVPLLGVMYLGIEHMILFALHPCRVHALHVQAEPLAVPVFPSSSSARGFYIRMECIERGVRRRHIGYKQYRWSLLTSVSQSESKALYTHTHSRCTVYYWLTAFESANEVHHKYLQFCWCSVFDGCFVCFRIDGEHSLAGFKVADIKRRSIQRHK